jgi:FkbM family methyltransferase
MQVNRDNVYRSPRQRLSWVQHFLKARFKSKEAPRVRALGRHIRAGDVILDVGAHFGYLTKEFAQLHGGACRVIAFEPVEYTRSILERVVRRFSNVRVEPLALSDRNGPMDIAIPLKKSGVLGIGLSHFGPETRRDHVIEPVEMRRLDDYAAASGLDRVDFIKADVEGAELLVLQGGRQTLERHRPAIYLEIGAPLTARMGYAPTAIFELLAGLDYAAHTMADDGALTPVPGYLGEGQDDYFFKARR